MKASEKLNNETLESIAIFRNFKTFFSNSLERKSEKSIILSYTRTILFYNEFALHESSTSNMSSLIMRSRLTWRGFLRK